MFSDVVVFTVASNDTDGFRRYVRSARVNGFDDKLKILGFREVWKGGNIRKYPGGGYKVNLFKKALEEYKDNTEKIILFTDR